MTKIPKLLDYLEQHDVTAWPEYDGRIGVVARYVLPGGDPLDAIEYLPAELPVIRAWLGY